MYVGAASTTATASSWRHGSRWRRADLPPSSAPPSPTPLTLSRCCSMPMLVSRRVRCVRTKTRNGSSQAVAPQASTLELCQQPVSTNEEEQPIH